MVRVLVVLLLISCAPASASAVARQVNDPAACELPYAETLPDFLVAVPLASVTLKLEGDETRPFMDEFNSVPPVSRHRADVIVFLRSPVVPIDYLIIAYQGCIIIHAPVNPSITEEYRAKRGSGI